MSQQSSSLTLTVQTGPQLGQTFVLKDGVNSIGRDQASDICLPERSVSRNHARIVIQQSGTRIEDLGSSNGTFVNGQRITTPTWLRPGDTVQIGTTVTLKAGGQTAPGQNSPSKTTSVPGGAAPGTAPASLNLVIQHGPQAGKVFPLVSGPQTIGRIPGNQIVIADPTISKQHARITVQPSGVFIQDLGSSNGTFVNGRRITIPTQIKPGETVQVGTSVTLGVQSVGALLPVQQPSYIPATQPHSPPPVVFVPSSPGQGLGGIIALSALLVLVGIGVATWLIWQRFGSSPGQSAVDQAVATSAPTPVEVIVTKEPTPEPVPDVDIDFTAAQTTVKLGECVTLRWNVDNAQEVRLDGEVVPAEGSRKVCPREASQTYRLTVLTLDGKNKEEAVSVTVPPTPPPPPEVEIDFAADQTIVNYGSCTILRWSVKNVQAVRLDGEQVGSQGTREVCPKEPANTYRLLVDPLEGEIIERAVAINVPATPTPTPTPTPKPKPVYINFTADQYTLRARECTTLRWTVSNAHTVRLDGTTVASQSSQRVCPLSLTNNYRLTAIGSNGQSAEETVTITVMPQPQLSLTVDQGILQQGSCTTLRWQAQDVQAAYLSGGGQFNNLPVSGSGSQQICLANTTTYMLTANLIGGGSDSRSVTVNMSIPPPPPPAPSVPPRYDIGATGGYVDSQGRRCFTLQGFMEGVREAYLDGGQFNNEPLTGFSWTKLVCHYQTTTYVMTVILPDGSRDSVSVTREGP